MTRKDLTSQDSSPLSKATVFHAQLSAKSKKVNSDPIFKIRDSGFARLFLIHEETVPQMNLEVADVWKRRSL